MLSVIKATKKTRAKCRICSNRIKDGTIIRIEGVKNKYGYIQLNYHAGCMLHKLEPLSDPVILDWQSRFSLR